MREFWMSDQEWQRLGGLYFTMGIREQGLWFRFILAALFIHGVKEMLLLKQLLKVEKLQQQTQMPL